jgi:DNA-binding transcriptional ArsR family regulator
VSDYHFAIYLLGMALNRNKDLTNSDSEIYLNTCSDIQGANMSTTKAKCLDGEACQVRVIHLDRVERARRETVSGKELARLSSIYKVLGDPSRLKIVMALRNVEMCVCDLAAFLGLTESAISHQLRRLKDLALVKSRREGQVIYYSLDDEHVAELLNIGLAHVTEPDDRGQKTEVR